MKHRYVPSLTLFTPVALTKRAGKEEVMSMRRGRMGRLGKAVLVAALACFCLGFAALPSIAAAKPEYGCPPGFVGYTLAEGLSLPRVQEAIAAGLYTVDQVTFVFDSIDHNGDGINCFQDVAVLNGAHGNYANGYNLIDNNASIPT